MSQTQIGQSQGEVSLQNFSLPAGALTEKDLPRVQAVIQQVVKNISESIKTGQQSIAGSDGHLIVSGIRILKTWLAEQACIRKVTFPYEDPGKYSNDFLLDYIFLSYPGQIPVNIVFNTEFEKTAGYRLLLFVNPVDLLKFASFAENSTVYP